MVLKNYKKLDTGIINYVEGKGESLIKKREERVKEMLFKGIGNHPLEQFTQKLTKKKEEERCTLTKNSSERVEK